MHPDEQFPHDEWREEEYNKKLRELMGEEVFLEKPITQSDISATLAERGGRYGQFIDHAKISQGLQDVMREAPNWDKLDVDMRQALTTIVDKIARILNGDPYYSDSWHDISGYATLVERRLVEIENATEKSA